ncbi:hypothetical protein FP2506_11467 [Fulvimarina pelagi HTCC2506]|uniref:DUF935 domain-containing protein n=1 Tax=Fulvimarina pelagi HTCC2506 TaxID=314231 RepID=Q0FYY6_9HYPH|nr:DUF935 domain-containing protein [Fulvimarina pelagi]EAU40172.1 hypothetical protein FP2506_11467 [Fulvimarina pelagi HTCC2506]
MVKASIHRFMDRWGRSPDAGSLSMEFATPQEVGPRRVIGETIISGLGPRRLASILQESAQGRNLSYLTLAEEMEERYLHYASQLQTRRLAIEGIAPSIEHDETVPAKIVDAVNALIEGDAFEEMSGSLTDAIGKGYSVSEMIWEYQDRVLQPVEYKWRDPRFFQFDEATRTELRLRDMSDIRNGLELPAAKFIVHEPRTKMGLTIRRGMARPAAWAFLIQSYSLKDWAAFAEIYGVPLRVGKYHANASDKDKRSLLRAVRDISNDAAAIIPMGMEFEFAKVEGQHGESVFGGLLDYCDKQVSKLILGQTMTSDDGSSQAQANVHNDVRLDILKADAKQQAQTINRDLIRPFVIMNFGEQAVYPRVAFPVAEPEDIKGLTDAVSRMVPLGLKVSQREMRERIGLGEPEDDEELLVPEAKAPAIEVKPGTAGVARESETVPPTSLAVHTTGCRCSSCAIATLAAKPAPVDAVDEVEQLAAEALSEWEAIADPILTPLRAIIAEETTFEGVLKRLETEGPDTRRLAAALARSTAIARGIGDVDD